MYKTYKEKQKLTLNDIFFKKPKQIEITTHYEKTPSLNIIKETEYYKSTIKMVYNDAKNWLAEHNDFLTNKNKYYYSFKIPKRKGGWRPIDAPNEELKQIQSELLNLMVNNLKILPHNAAHAYVKERSTLTMAEKHKQNKCIIKLDIHNFFNSITTEILKEKLHNIEAFTILDNEETEYNFTDTMIELATKDGHLIQGNPLSPFLSNMIMLEFDNDLTIALNNHHLPKYVYTRYADDMFLSAPKFAATQKVINFIDNKLKLCYHNCIELNKEKTELVKCTNKCYITGIKLNKDHNLTFGHEHKKELKLKLYNLFIAYRNHEATLEEAQEILGLFSYMKQIEPEYGKYLEQKYLRMFNSTAKTLAKHFKF